MTPLLIGLGAALAALAIGWLVAAVLRRMRRARRSSAKNRGRETVSAGVARPPGSGEVDAKVAAVIRDAERSLAEARRQAAAIVMEAQQQAAEIAAAAESAAQTLLAGARLSAERTASGITEDAKSAATAIVRDAEARAREIGAKAERERAEFEREMAYQRRLADKSREELLTMLLNLLEKARRQFGDGAPSVRDLGEAQRSGADEGK